MYDFDSKIDRKNTGSWKWLTVNEPVKSLGYLPLTIADMELSVPDPIKNALVKAAMHGICGYTIPDDEYYTALTSYMQRRHNFKINNDEVLFTSGVVPALGIAVRAFTNEGDGVIIQPPVYPPFANTVRINGRKLLENPLINNDGHFEMDFDNLQSLAKSGRAKLLILCSPHNPVGRVWTREELLRLGNICKEYGITVVADEIHCDIVHKGHEHTVFASLPGMDEISVICTAMSKTFNLAGLMCSNIIVKNPDLRRKMQARIDMDGSCNIPYFACAATKAAYTECDKWVDSLLSYIESNFEFCYNFIQKRIPKIKCIRAEGTYLLYLDCRALNMDDKELECFMLNKAHLALDEGYIFGTNGSGFERINIAAPLKELESALIRLENAVNSLEN